MHIVLVCPYYYYILLIFFPFTFLTFFFFQLFPQVHYGRDKFNLFPACESLHLRRTPMSLFKVMYHSSL